MATDLIEHLRVSIDPAAAADPYRATLQTIMREIVQLSAADIAALPLDTAFALWLDHDRIEEALRNSYSAMLNLRIPGIPERDYLLWHAVDVRAKYGHLADPDVEHLAIAILVLEGCVTQIASANWDGLIEVAVDRLRGRFGRG